MPNSLQPTWALARRIEIMRERATKPEPYRIECDLTKRLRSASDFHNLTQISLINKALNWARKNGGVAKFSNKRVATKSVPVNVFFQTEATQYMKDDGLTAAQLNNIIESWLNKFDIRKPKPPLSAAGQAEEAWFIANGGIIETPNEDED